MAVTDRRPRTAVMLQHTGIGDLIWHIRYCEAVARQSREGKIILVAQPSSMARQLLVGAEWIEQIIDHDHRPRRSDKRKGRHAGLLGMWRMGQQLKQLKLDRLILCSGRTSRGLIALFSGVPIRLGYGYRFLQRLCLTDGPFISAHRGSEQAIFPELSSFMLAHNFSDSVLTPRVTLPDLVLDRMESRLGKLPHPRVTLAIGTSEPHKQWGADNFSKLSQALLENGASVILLGGPAEDGLAHKIMQSVPASLHTRLVKLTDTNIQESGAVLFHSDVCVGNDTGMVNLAAATGCQTWVLMGPRAPLEHDPDKLHNVRAKSLAEITVESVVQTIAPVLTPFIAGN